MEAIHVYCDEAELAARPLLNNLTIDMKDMILTPYTCTCLVIEILKALLYEKQQIPYPYAWLKNAIAKRKPEPNIHSHNISIIIQKYFNLAYNAYNCVEDIAFNMNQMMHSDNSLVEEVVILFGSTPYTPREMFTLRFPEIAKGHIESNHRSMLQKKLHNVLRNVFLSEEWLKAMQHTLPTTNAFIMVKKVGVLRHEDDYFEHYTNFVVPNTIRNTIFTLSYDKKYDTCCQHLKVYEDHAEEPATPAIKSIQARNVEWYQAKGIVKGFQDFFIEKVSVSELW